MTGSSPVMTERWRSSDPFGCTLLSVHAPGGKAGLDLSYRAPNIWGAPEARETYP
jgi:hypothetical protein